MPRRPAIPGKYPRPLPHPRDPKRVQTPSASQKGHIGKERIKKMAKKERGPAGRGPDQKTIGRRQAFHDEIDAFGTRLVAGGAFGMVMV